MAKDKKEKTGINIPKAWQKATQQKTTDTPKFSTVMDGIKKWPESKSRAFTCAAWGTDFTYFAIDPWPDYSEQREGNPHRSSFRSFNISYPEGVITTNCHVDITDKLEPITFAEFKKVCDDILLKISTRLLDEDRTSSTYLIERRKLQTALESFSLLGYKNLNIQ